MAYSYVTYTGNGSARTFSVPFGYISKDHITVLVDGGSTPFTWDDAATVRLATAPATGLSIKVRRDTPKTTKVVDFNNAAALTEVDLDRNADQALYNTQEAIDYANDLVAVAVAAAEAAAGTVARAVPLNTGADNGKALVAGPGGTYTWEDSFLQKAGGVMTGALTLMAPSASSHAARKSDADAAPAAKASALSGGWSGANDLTTSPVVYFDIMLPDNAASVLIAGWARLENTQTNGVLGLFRVGLLDASLVQQAFVDIGAAAASSSSALFASAALAGSFSPPAGNTGWRLRFTAWKAAAIGPFYIYNYNAHALVIAR